MSGSALGVMEDAFTAQPLDLLLALALRHDLLLDNRKYFCNANGLNHFDNGARAGRGGRGPQGATLPRGGGEQRLGRGDPPTSDDRRRVAKKNPESRCPRAQSDSYVVPSRSGWGGL